MLSDADDIDDDGATSPRAERVAVPAKMSLLLGMGGLYNKALSYLPGDLAARIDFARPLLHQGWGGPMNGQDERQAVVRDLYRAIPFATTVETGSFRGHTTQFLAALTEGPVWGVESNPRFFGFARRNCAGYPNVTLRLADSRSFLRDHLEDCSGPVFFYLDAHWYADLPLADEVRMIAASGLDAVIMIDDFEVPGDDGYAFDDYGPGRRLDADLLKGIGIDSWTTFYPAVNSAQESGLRRGSVVLASPGLAQRVGAVTGLRAAADAH